MKIIAHRGNLNGPNPEFENNPDYIDESLNQNFEAEIDVWYLDNNFYLGHDLPLFKIDKKWILDRSDKLWCHAKNIEAIEQMFEDTLINYFWHETDKITLTSKGIPWCYPNTYTSRGITVEYDYKIIPDVYGICTDYCLTWRKKCN
jgi:hypothetical protein